MEISVEWLALIVSVVAIALGIRESMLNHTTILKIIELKFHFQMGVKHSGYSELFILIKNMGIPLHSPTFHLHYRVPDKGTMQLEFSVENCDKSELAKGMYAELKIQSHKYLVNNYNPVHDLLDVHKQDVCLFVRSQGYLAFVIPLSGWKQKLKETWNRFAGKINHRMSFQYTKDGAKFVKMREYVPYFSCYSGKIQQFADAMRKGGIW